MYCPKCGNKLSENSKFCSKCGNKIIKKTEEKKTSTKQVKPKEKMTVDKKENILLIVGTILVIIASVIFAFATWNEMTNIFKLLFLTIESLLFVSLSLFSKKTNQKMPYKFLWFIGISFIPIMFHLIGYHQMLGDYLSYDGNGIYVYLSISSFICGVIYFLSYKFLNSSFFEYISFIAFYFMIIYVLYIFKLDDIGTGLIFPILNLLNLILCIIFIKMKNETEKKRLDLFTNIVVILFAILNLVNSIEYSGILLFTIPLIINLATCVLLIFKSNRKLIYIYPILCYLLVQNVTNEVFASYLNIIAFAGILGVVLINLIIHQRGDKPLNIISYVFMILNVFIILVEHSIDEKTKFICYIMLLLTYIFIIKISDVKFNIVVSKLLLPVTLHLALFNLIRYASSMSTVFISLMSSVILFTIYTVLNHNKNDNLLKMIFQIWSYVYLISAVLILLMEDINISAFIISEAIWIYYYIYNFAVNKNKGMSIWMLVMVILNFVICSLKYSLPIYYSLLFASFITLIIDYINIKVYKAKSIYIYPSIACCALASLRGFYGLSIFGVCLNIIIYALTYFVMIKEHKAHIVVKFFYTLIGFILIYSLFTRFVENIVISNILIFIIYLCIIISMFLLRVNDDNVTFGYSIILLFPYINIVENVELFTVNNVAFYTAITVILALIYFERVFKMKEQEKNVLELILFILIHILTIFNLLIFNFIISAFYIFYGLFKSREDLSILGIVILIINIIFNIFNIANNITITYVLLFIGVLMLTYVFYIEAKKNNKK